MASSALEEPIGAGTLTLDRTIERNAIAYVATEVLDVVAMAERRLANAKFDTRITSPSLSFPRRHDRDAPQHKELIPPLRPSALDDD